MTKLRLRLALGLAIMFDAASGLAVYHGLSRLAGRETALLGYGFAMFLGLLPDLGVAATLFGNMLAIFLALLPGFNVVVEKLRSRGVTGEHKTSFTHVPLVFMPLTVAAILPFSRFWAWVAILCLAMHYLHDLFETGPGIPLFTPFADQRYLLCKRRQGLYMIVYPLTQEELQKWLNMTLPQWLEWQYCHITSNSVLGPMALAATLLMVWLW